MSARHTPGPWVCDGAILEFEGARFGQVAYVLEKEGEPFYASAANARLIAAAPDLLEALQELLSHWRDGSSFDEDAEARIEAACDAAIAKATQP